MALKVCVLVNWFVLAHAAVFLQPQVTKDDVQQVLLSELLGHKNTAKIRNVENEMSAMFLALPKNEDGKLEPATVRYALHRYFVQKNGWYVKGLDQTNGSAWTVSSTDSILKARAPAFIQSLLEEHLVGKGMGLHELAVFAATLSDLIHAETTSKMEWIYASLNLTKVGRVPATAFAEARNAFLVAHLTTGDKVASNSRELTDMAAEVQELYPNFNETAMWMEDLIHVDSWEQRHTRNPFVVEVIPSFKESVAFALKLSHRFGAFQNLECHTLKRKLVDLEHMGTGRVPLSVFYSHALEGVWEFMESEAYLRNQGALDDTDPDHPSLMIANYMNSQANCLVASPFYSVCCINECDGLLAHLEHKLAAPHARPASIAAQVSNLQSDTVDAPRNLSAALLTRLNEIAEFHGGHVPLHGRMFAQWMHHAYPRECEFPHLMGTVLPLSPEEFAAEEGSDALEATHWQMMTYASKNPQPHAMPLPWIAQEELMAQDKHRKRSSFRMLHFLAACAALLSFAVPLMRALRMSMGNVHVVKSEKHFV
jgi:hypothetical protein